MDALTTASALSTMDRLANRRDMLTSFVSQQRNVEKQLLETLDKAGGSASVLAAPGPGRGLSVDISV